MTGQEIYENFHNGAGTGGLEASADTVHTVVDGYLRLAEEVHRLTDELAEVWRGEAADGAREAARPLLVEHEAAAGHLSRADDLVTRQVASFVEARNRVVPVPPAPAAVEPWALADPAEMVTFQQRVQEHNAAAQNNVDTMAGYAGASTYNTENLPMTYGHLGVDGGDVSLGRAGAYAYLRPADDDSTGPGPGGATPRPGTDVERVPEVTGPGAADGAGTGTDRGPRGPVAGTPGPDTGGGAGPGGAGPGGAGPGGAGPGGGGTEPAGRTGGGPTTPGDARDTTRPSGAGRETPGTVRGADPPGGTGIPGGGRSLDRPGGTGPEAPGGFRGGAGRGAEPSGRPRGAEPPAVRGVGVRGGDGAIGGRPARAGGGASGGAGRGAVPGGLPVAAPNRDEDRERGRPTYLEGEDPEELFGCDVLLPPATIGGEDD